MLTFAELDGIREAGIARSKREAHDYGLFREGAYALVTKWDDPDRHAAGLPPDDLAEAFGNLLTTAGLTRMFNLLHAAGGQGYNTANTAVGVGDNAGAVTALIGDTDLTGAATGSTHRQWKNLASSGCSGPTLSAGQATYVAQYGSAEANFSWGEWGIGQATADGTGAITGALLNHKIAALGTKVSSNVWTFTAVVSVA